MTLDRAEVSLALYPTLLTAYAHDPETAARRAVQHADQLLLALTPPVAGPCPGEDARDDAEARARVSAPVAPKSEAAKYEPAPGDVIDLYGGRGSCEPHMTRIAVNRDEYAALNCGKFEARYRYDLHPTVTPVFLRPATPAERIAAGLDAAPVTPPPATRPTHIRVVRRGKNAPAFVTEGAVLKVDEWDAAGDPWVGNGRWCFCGHRNPHPSNTTWEPAPAPVEPAKGEAVKYLHLLRHAHGLMMGGKPPADPEQHSRFLNEIDSFLKDGAS